MRSARLCMLPQMVQVNALVPQSVAPANVVPVTITIGGVAGQAGVTLAVT